MEKQSVVICRNNELIKPNVNSARVSQFTCLFPSTINKNAPQEMLQKVFFMKLKWIYPILLLTSMTSHGRNRVYVPMHE